MAEPREQEEREDEWTLHTLTLPADDYDEDDELDARLEDVARRKRSRVSRGGFFGTM